MSMTLEEVRSENVEDRIAREKRRERERKRKKTKRKQRCLEREELNPEGGEGGGGRERIRPGRLRMSGVVGLTVSTCLVVRSRPNGCP